MRELAGWDSFYVIVGAAAGALIGLQFVVITLVAARPPTRPGEALAAFATPTIVHFSTALLLSALLRAPWHTVAPIAILWGVIGLAGVTYAIAIAWRMRTQTTYQPDIEDWLSHALLPLVAYTILVVSALAAFIDTRDPLFGVGAATLLLLFIGIHNAWDNITYFVLMSHRDTDAER